MSERTLLIADIGGTNARFALANVDAPGFSNEEILKCADFPSVEAAIEQYLEQLGAGLVSTVCFLSFTTQALAYPACWVVFVCSSPCTHYK